MMLNRRYSSFFVVVIVTFLFLVGCLALSTSQPQDSEKKAFEVAHDACGVFRRMGIEQVDNSEAVLETWGESAVSKVWVVRLTGTWQSADTPDSSVPASEWLIVCEVSISSNDWHVINTRQTRTKTNP
jgi:hypothetical protein